MQRLNSQEILPLREDASRYALYESLAASVNEENLAFKVLDLGSGTFAIIQ